MLREARSFRYAWLVALVMLGLSALGPPWRVFAAGIPAFPGAEGFGAVALQSCRDKPLNVIFVTTTREGGPGSIRDALRKIDNGKYNIIIFRVGGYVRLYTRLDVNNVKCLYIAGQTAPGDGITFIGTSSIRFAGPNEDVVLRYLRFRPGEGTSAVNVSSGRRFVLDHLSTSWTSDKMLLVAANAPDEVVDITVQRTILSEVFASHPTAMQLTGEPRNDPPNDRLSIHRNFFAHNSHRNPVLGTYNVQFVNNVVYNWRQGASHSGGPENLARADFVNNYYKVGPMTHPELTYEVTVNCGTSPGLVSLYVAGNVGPHNSDTAATPEDQWVTSRVTACYYGTGGSYGAEIPAELGVRRDTRLEQPADFPPHVLDAVSARNDVLSDVGANKRLTCDGRWIAIPDAVDLRLFHEFWSGTGPDYPPGNMAETTGFPPLDPGTPCADSDEDGLPDEWERLYPAAGAPGEDADGDGYLNIEEYLNGTDPLAVALLPGAVDRRAAGMVNGEVT